ncbi:response regulator transcription factor [Mesorhizobium sp. B2-3-12]|uniref:winged helix-turn-helix transcriptional regulator n=1 Tax=Mesorhizobium sp. B2-3-12 TaxID=2589952 RepID=UPI00112C5A63|nr:response regulator transcription factor [Mesorhizobium sp. B2-3-12]TPL88669.1 response regulator transcription factor [Mesorhizobium sp. B2-3-12]
MGLIWMRPSILVCSADAGYYLLISYILDVEGFACVPASDCAKALELLQQRSFTAVLLDCDDRASFGSDAIDRVCKASREQHVPLVALVPAGSEILYLELLKAGIDHIFVSPHPPAQILRALRLLSETGEEPAAAPEVDERMLSWGKLTLSAQRHQVQYDGKDIVVGAIQFKLLAMMLHQPGRIFSREELIRAAWAPNIYVEPRTVDVHVGRLRDALRKVTGRNLIRTVRGAGYGLNGGVEPANS